MDMVSHHGDIGISLTCILRKEVVRIGCGPGPCATGGYVGGDF
jgi:hypothetical protein